MATPDRFTVSQVARMAHVTVRALHHYDAIGLLVPLERGANGYRLYGEGDLLRLQQILLFRQLGFGLDAIGRLLDAAAFERQAALEAQRELLLEQRRRTDAIVRGVDAVLKTLEKGGQVDTKEMFDGFQEFDQKALQEEAEARWGNTESYKESMQRTRSYSKDDWASIKQEGEDIWERMGALMDSGGSAEGSEAMDLAEQHRLHIDRWFYPCTHGQHSALGQMYTADPRFTEYFEKRHVGLAAFVQAAIEANGVRGA